MNALHIVQGGIENGDKAWLETAARKRLTSPSWVAPKAAAIGDEVVIYVPGFGFFATARVTSHSKPREDWTNRYGSALKAIRLIQPPITIATIQRRLPELTWAKYPRSITTPSAVIADRIRALIRERRKTGVDDDELAALTIDELRSAALLKARAFATKKERKGVYCLRSLAIRLYVLRRANGRCEACGSPAPFRRADGSPYLEPHHTRRLADDGPDHPAAVIGLCPNCHRRAHHAEDAHAFNASLMKKLPVLEPE
jgi:hypothetical protein